VDFEILVPPAIEEIIHSWGLSLEAEDHIYALLGQGVTREDLDTMHRLAAPTPTFIKNLEFQDPLILGILHVCTFWFTFGEKDDALYVLNCEHEEEEDWDTDLSVS
jgi:hypothetical protein